MYYVTTPRTATSLGCTTRTATLPETLAAARTFAAQGENCRIWCQTTGAGYRYRPGLLLRSNGRYGE